MKNILIVDDHEENLYLLRILLTARGYQVQDALNGSDALVKALATPPDMVISDILMPVIDGFSLCRIFKADRRLRHIPFIFYTATYTDPRDEQLAFDLGADAFILKPAEPDEFLGRIKPILEAGKSGNLGKLDIGLPREEGVLKQYNEALIRKLEHKMLKLEEVKKELETEIESRKQSETALRESEERFRSLFENSFDGVLLTVPDGNIVKANQAACRMFGRSEEEICLVRREGLVDISDPRLAEALEKRKRTGRFCGELTFLRKDGARFPGEISSVVFKDSAGNPRTSMIIRDITERKTFEEKLLKNNEALEQKVMERTAELQETVARLEELNRVFVGRELKMTELKKRISELEKNA